MEVIENIGEWRESYAGWQKDRGAASDDIGDSYPFVKNRRAPFSPARRALPMLNLALISSAGAYIDGTDPFDTGTPEGDVSFREIPSEIRAEELRFASRGYERSRVETREPVLSFVHTAQSRAVLWVESRPAV